MRIHPTLTVSLACLSLFACGKREGITQRDEPLAEVTPPAAAATPRPAMPKTQVGPGETLWAGAVPADGGQWVTFKTIGPSAAITKHTAELESILDARDGSLPVGWTQEEASAQEAQFGRLATFHSPAPEITVAVNRAGGSVASNVNRWRGQAGLAKLTDAEAEAAVKKLADGAWTLALEGQAKTAAKTPPATAPQPAVPAADLAFTLPAGWVQVQPASGMILAQFSAGSGDQACKVTLTRLVGAVGGTIGTTLENLNRWRGQLKLAPLAAMPTQAQTQAVPMEISGAPGVVMPIAAGPGEPAAPTAMLVAFVADADNTYFIKLTGPTTAVEAQLTPMTGFLKSLKLPLAGAPAPLPADLKLLPKIGK